MAKLADAIWFSIMTYNYSKNETFEESANLMEP